MANALPADDLCTENAIMIKRFNRYPLVVDPSGQATEFIMNEYKEQKIHVTKTRYKTGTCIDSMLLKGDLQILYLLLPYLSLAR